MNTANTVLHIPPDDSLMLAQTYQQTMNGLSAIVMANPPESGIVILKPGQLTRVAVQSGKNYKLRKTGIDGTLQTPDNLVAVRHANDLHVRYADGSAASFDSFYTVCTGGSVCSVNLANDSGAGMNLSASDSSGGPVADDGMLAYAHGDPAVLLSMAQDQPALASAIRGVNDSALVTYIPPDSHPGALAVLALGALGAAGAAHASAAGSVSALSSGSALAATAPYIDTISAAAQNNTATSSHLAASVYASASVTGVTAANLGAINSALDSAAITGAQADTVLEVQAIVDAYRAILASADGVSGNTAMALTASQYAAIGVTGVSGTATPGNALFMLNAVLDAKSTTAVDTVAKVQALVDATKHIIDAAGGDANQAAAVSLADLVALGIVGVTTANLSNVQAAIRGTVPDVAIDTPEELQHVVNAAIGSVGAALNTIAAAADANNATASSPDIGTYAAAAVTGVTSANLSAINSALNSSRVTAAQADTTAEVQAIVDAYATIFSSADGVAGNATNGPTSQQYALIGVTGVTGTPAADSGIFLLNNALDSKTATGVDTVAEVQTLADAANHVISGAAGGAAPTLSDLTVLGITGVTNQNLTAVQVAIAATDDSGTGVNTLVEIQNLVNAVNSGVVTNALNTIRDAAQNNTATDTSPAISVYAAAGVTGVSTSDLAAINSALNSAAVTGAQADTTPEVQAIVDAYNAILASADGTPDNTATALSGAQYTLAGVTGVSGISAPGNALHLLDSVVDASLVPAVDTVPELQAMADASAHVITGSAGGTAPSLGDLNALGITGVTAANLAAVQAAIAATNDDGTGVDTRGELQAVVTAAVGASQVPHISSTLSGVTNLDVTSNLVLSADQSVVAGSGFIHITDMGGTGYRGDTNNNTQTIDVATAVANHLLTITGTGANTHIVINPMWDLDLSSNYQITFDSGVFLDAGDSHAAVAVAPINFSTVTPGTHSSGTAASEAHASQMMVDSTGALVAGKSWLDIQGIGSNTGPVAQLGDLSGGAYALVMKNYATARGGSPAQGGNGSDGIATHDTNIGVVNFGNDDIVYFDSQVNNSAIQFFDARYTSMTDGATVGGLTGQNALVMGLVSSPQQLGSTAMILLGLEGNATNQIYSSIVSLPDGTVGWANVWHSSSPAVIMG